MHPYVAFFTSWKRQKTIDFLMFSGGLEMQNWREMSLKEGLFCYGLMFL